MRVTHLRHEIRVEASTSADSSRVVATFIAMVDGVEGENGLDAIWTDLLRCTSLETLWSLRPC